MANKKNLQAAGSSVFDKMFSGLEDNNEARGPATIHKDAMGGFEGIAGKNGYARINREDIVPSPYNEGLHMGDMDAYVSSLRESGLIEPITVYSRDDGKYEILSGHQRFHAWCTIMGNETINAIVRPYEKDPVKRFMAHTQANVLQRNKDINFWLTRIETAGRILDEEGFSGSEAERKQKISEMLGGVSIAQLYRYQSFRGLIPELQELESQRILSVFTLYAAASLEHDMQVEVYKRVQLLLSEKQEAGDDVEVTRDEFNYIVASVKSDSDKDPGTHEKSGNGQKGLRPTYIDRVGKTYGGFLKSIGRYKTDQDKKEAAEFIRRVRTELEALERELELK